MALPPNFLDELRARTPLPGVIGRRVRLARSGRQWKGCCPFHGEKTPSFYVYEDHFHCFGCGAHGDAIGFVMQSQGSGFMEAVEQLAAEAGLDVPEPTPEAAEAERERHTLESVLQAAEVAYQRRLFLPEGRAALEYLRGRGLTEETIRRFGLGWSGEGRGALTAELTRDGITQDQLVEGGLMRRDEDSGRVYDLFFNRVMFPIRDRRGRTISFGGRILGEGQPKYVNGPETPLFAKRRNLYGIDLAREGIRTGATLVVVEGYMDVIALAQAGFSGAVAPLGTALTEGQMDALWRLSPMPILCFDGDAAGGRAAARAAEMALPLLAPDRTLKLATLPGGEDPDSLVRRQGRPGFDAVLNAAQPLSDALYDLLREICGDSTPEARAAFRNRLEEAAKRIPDKALASEYRDALLARFYANRRRAPSRRRDGGDRPVKGAVRVPPRPSLNAQATTLERTRILTAILLLRPEILPTVEAAYATLMLDPSLSELRGAIIEWAIDAELLDSAALIDHLNRSGLRHAAKEVLSGTSVSLPAVVASASNLAEAADAWWHFFELLTAKGVRADQIAAQEDAIRSMTPESQRKLVALSSTLKDVRTSELDGTDLTSA